MYLTFLALTVKIDFFVKYSIIGDEAMRVRLIKATRDIHTQCHCIIRYCSQHN